ncbi:hypothetical protein RIF29_28306 [Crotalaria pallida]|uniref:BHLH domain-containing protein n=1 Tax=Crotalaria pallida TaxID=3830 RepID=A0AAN9ERT8_CROPI
MDHHHHFNECLGNKNYFDDEEFLRNIMNHPFETTIPDATTTSGTILGQNNMMMMKNNYSSIITQQQYGAQNPTITTTTPTTYILSFDKATTTTTIGDDHHPNNYYCSATGWKDVSVPKLGSSHNNNNNNDNNNNNNAAIESLPLSSSRGSCQQGTKKSRSASETIDHIMSERNRRQELTKKFIALSATIPGLKKMDKAHVLLEAINYVKQLQERVKELEEDVQKKGVKSVITITRSNLCIQDDTDLCEMNIDENYGHDEALPDVEARVLGREVLIKIHCERQKGILVKILSQLEHLHLSISSSNVLPFGNTLDITIIAQMDDKCSLIVKDLVKNLRVVTMLKSCDNVQQ